MLKIVNLNGMVQMISFEMMIWKKEGLRLARLLMNSESNIMKSSIDG
jgi:hypothetical protein